MEGRRNVTLRNYIMVSHATTCLGSFPSDSLAAVCVSPCSVQLRNKLNQEQSAKLQQQRECLNRRNSEVAVMDKRVNELRDRLWKKKAALQQKENLPVSGPSCCGRGGGARGLPSEVSGQSSHPPRSGTVLWALQKTGRSSDLLMSLPG